jgi:hypothetical protein
MSDRGRKAYEAMIEAAKAYGVFGSVGGCVAVMGNRIRAWQDAGEWRPTEQHETVTEILVEIDNHLADDSLDSDLDKVVAPWLEAGKPGLPQPVDPYGAEITGDFGGRCPVERDEVIEWRVWDCGAWTKWSEDKADDLTWAQKFQFRRLKADHPGDSYWLGKGETYKPGEAKLDISEVIQIGNVGGPAVLVYMSKVRSSPHYGLVPFSFQRRLKCDA